MPLTVLDHPLAGHLLTQLRDKQTPPERFRQITRALTQLLVIEGTRNLPTRAVTVSTPLEDAPGSELAGGLVAVPILRAGLGMLDTVIEMLPGATVGYFGMVRDEKTAIANTYYFNLPPLQGKSVFLLDPMLATGGSASHAMDFLKTVGATDITMLCVVAAPEGVARLEKEFPDLSIVAASLDRCLNERSYIVPGLGDFGDRLYGTT